MKSLQTKILIFVISGLLLLSIAIGGVVLYATNQILYRNANTIMSFESENQSAKLNDMLGDMEKSIQIVSEAAESQLLSVPSLKHAGYQQSYTRDMEILFNNAARNTKGMMAYYFRYNPDFNLPNEGFYYGITDQGNQLEKFPVTDLSENRENIRWWHEPTSARTAVWISPHYHSNSDILMVSYVAPIYKDNTLIGVAGMDIQLSRLLDAVKEIAPYENGYAYLLSRTGEELYHPDDSQLEVSGQKIIKVNAPLKNGMTLVVCAYYADIQAQGNKLIAAMILLSIGIVALFVVLSVIFAKRIIKPLRRLALASQAIGEKPDLIEVECNPHDEIGVLYQAVTESNRRLYEYMGDVRAKAYRDSLTGLKNYAAYTEAVADLKRRICNEEETSRFAVVLFDINNLKLVNDTYGHEFGNELIVRVTKLLTSTFYRSEVYRVGGDEFIALLENDDYNDREALLTVFDANCAKEALTLKGESVPISVARGMAEYDPSNDTNYKNVLLRADGLMYQHKRETKKL